MAAPEGANPYWEKVEKEIRFVEIGKKDKQLFPVMEQFNHKLYGKVVKVEYDFTEWLFNVIPKGAKSFVVTLLKPIAGTDTLDYIYPVEAEFLSYNLDTGYFYLIIKDSK